MSLREPQVELLWWAGCPSWEEAHRLVRDEMAAADLDPERLELKILIEETLARYPNMELVGKPVFVESAFLNQLKSLGEAARRRPRIRTRRCAWPATRFHPARGRK